VAHGAPRRACHTRWIATNSAVNDAGMPHIIRKPGVLGGTTLAVFMTLVHTVNDAMTAILGALLPTLQVKFDAGPTALALMIAVFWVASSVTQPVFGALGEDIGLRVIGCAGVLMASAFLSLIGVASEVWVVFVLLVIGGLGSAALHPVGTTIAGSQATNATLGIGLFTAGGMVGFALGPVVILRVVSNYGLDATIWLAVPGLILGVAVGILLPQWEPHPRRPLRRLFDLRLARGPVGMLAVASMFSALAFITFTGSIPIWLVQEHDYAPDAATIGWTLSTFAFAGGLGSIVGGFLAPRLGPVLTIVGAFLLTLCPLLTVVATEPGTPLYYGAIALAGILIFVPIPALVIIAQEFVPGAPATASGMVLGLGSALAGIGYVVLGRVQEAVGLTEGILIGFSMVVPAALIALVVLLRGGGHTHEAAQEVA
jgi:FSR family fosmidomycin resistance protein-like MFS transporter